MAISKQRLDSRIEHYLAAHADPQHAASIARGLGYGDRRRPGHKLVFDRLAMLTNQGRIARTAWGCYAPLCSPEPQPLPEAQGPAVTQPIADLLVWVSEVLGSALVLVEADKDAP